MPDMYVRMHVGTYVQAHRRLLGLHATLQPVAGDPGLVETATCTISSPTCRMGRGFVMVRSQLPSYILVVWAQKYIAIPPRIRKPERTLVAQ